jgi:orotidine-5'-phosphate decarboxylase
VSFSEKIIARARALGHPLCVGLDPFADRIPRLFGEAGSIAAVEAFCSEMIDIVAPHAVAIKPQAGLFEPWGHQGIAVLERICAKARDAGLPVILDAKRGDIGTTADGYAEASLGCGQVFATDCVTVNPYMGLDTLEPFVVRAQANGRGVAVLVRTSNPGARDFQDLDVNGAPLWVRVAEALKPIEARLTIAGQAFSSLMVVCGATWPQEAARMRQILPRTLFLVPGYGAQGGSAADAVKGFVRSSDGVLEGGVVSASRSILYPNEAAEAGTLSEWRADILQAVRSAGAELSSAVSLKGGLA